MSEFTPVDSVGYIEGQDGDILPPDTGEQWYTPALEGDYPFVTQREYVDAVEIAHEGTPELVHLKDRAAALSAIMAYYNQAGKNDGLSRSGATGQREFDRRYGRASQTVETNMTRREAGLRQGFVRAVKVLVAEPALVSNGMPEVERDYIRARMAGELGAQFGTSTGNRRISDIRKKAAKSAKSLAEGKVTKKANRELDHLKKYVKPMQRVK